MVFILISNSVIAQKVLSATVVEIIDEPIFVASVFFKSIPKNGCTKDFDGQYRLLIEDTKDTLVVSYITKEIPLNRFNIEKNHRIVFSKKHIH